MTWKNNTWREETSGGKKKMQDRREKKTSGKVEEGREGDKDYGR